MERRQQCIRISFGEYVLGTSKVRKKTEIPQEEHNGCTQVILTTRQIHGTRCTKGYEKKRMSRRTLKDHSTTRELNSDTAQTAPQACARIIWIGVGFKVALVLLNMLSGLLRWCWLCVKRFYFGLNNYLLFKFVQYSSSSVPILASLNMFNLASSSTLQARCFLLVSAPYTLKVSTASVNKVKAMINSPKIKLHRAKTMLPR